MGQPVVTHSSAASVPLGSYASLGANYQPEITRLQAGLHDLAVAIDMANRTGQTQAATMLRQQFNTIKAQVDRLIQLQRAEDAKPTVTSRIGDVQTRAQDVVNTVSTAVGGLGKLIPFLAIGAAALLLLRRR